MKRLVIAGVGMADGKTLTKRAEEAISSADFLIGGRRLLAGYPDKPQMALDKNLREAVAYIEENCEKQRICVLVSGDTGFYSYTKYLLSKLPADIEAEVICGVGSMQYFCAKLHLSYEDMAAVSMHGRSGNLLSTISGRRYTFVLTGGEYRAQDVCRLLWERGGGSLPVSAGENLGGTGERILRGTAEELMKLTFGNLTVLLVENPQAAKKRFFEEDKLAALNCLKLVPEDCCIDLSGGEIAAAIAGKVGGDVLCRTKDAEGLRRICRKYSRYNIKPVPEGGGDAGITAAYAEGSGMEALFALLKRNPELRFALAVRDKGQARRAAMRLQQLSILFDISCHSRLNAAFSPVESTYIFHKKGQQA